MTTSPLFVLLAEENKPIDRVYTMPKHFENRTKSCHLFNHIIAVITLAGLFMHVGTDCSWFDERTDLNSHIYFLNQQTCNRLIFLRVYSISLSLSLSSLHYIWSLYYDHYMIIIYDHYHYMIIILIWLLYDHYYHMIIIILIWLLYDHYYYYHMIIIWSLSLSRK